jgi:hypothetical protein
MPRGRVTCVRGGVQRIAHGRGGGPRRAMVSGIRAVHQQVGCWAGFDS